ncbi:MAG TPA: MFS transporter [Terriglobales bacterium]|nr:MFS transporter [Terriglobales bacterium]
MNDPKTPSDNRPSPDLPRSGGPKPQPPKAYRWLVLIFVSLTMFGNYYIFDSINPLVDIFRSQLGFSASVIGYLNSAYNGAAILALAVGGIIVDRFGTKRSITFFSILCLIASAWMVISGHAWSMLAARFVLGLGAEPLIVAVTTAIAKWFKGKELSFAFGVNLLIARAASWLADNSPTWASWAFDGTWYRPLHIGIAAGLICVVAALIYWVLEARGERLYTVGEAAATDKLRVRDAFLFGRTFWYIVALCVTFYAVVFSFRLFGIDYFISAHGRSREAAGRLNGFLPLMAMWATPVFGLIADRVGKRATFMLIGSGAMPLVFLLMGYSQASLWLPVGMLGVAFSLIPAIMWPSVAYLVEQRRLGSAYALMTLCQQVGWLIMNQAIGYSQDRFRATPAHPAGYLPMLWILTGVSLLGIVFAFLLWRAGQGPEAHALETITTKTGV